VNRRGWWKRSKFSRVSKDLAGSDHRFSLWEEEGRYRLGHRPVRLRWYASDLARCTVRPIHEYWWQQCERSSLWSIGL